MEKKDVINYYQSSQWLYRLFIYDSNSLGMHFGFWDKQTKNRQEAILNENKAIITHGGIKKGMKVLDAGCGVGGTALYIAKQTGASVHGITLDPQQVTLTRKYAKKRNLTHLTEFSTQDYSHTNFPDNYFDVVYGIESICHATPKSAFLKEAHRVLKPKGKLIISDAYTTRVLRTIEEKKAIEDFNRSFALSELIIDTEMTKQIRKNKFTHVQLINKTKEVIPTIIFFHNLTRVTKYFCILAKYIPSRYAQAMYNNYLAMASTKAAYDLGIFTYHIHSATKPK